MMKKPKAPKAADDMKAGMPMPRFGARAMRPGGMAKGGKIHADAAMDRKLIRKEIARAEKMEHKSEEKGAKKGGEVKKMFRGGTLNMPAAGPRGPMTTPAANEVRSGPAAVPRGSMTTPAANDVRPAPVRGPRIDGPRGGRPATVPGPARGPYVDGTLGGRRGAMNPNATRDVAPAPPAARPFFMSGMKKGGEVKKMARGGGVEIKGKTKGKFI